MTTGDLMLILGAVICACLYFLNKKILIKKFIEPTRNTPYTDFKKCNPPLWTINLIGFRLFQGGRYDYDTNSYSFYLFFCCILPLFPVRCYRATEVSDSGEGTSYMIYGHEQWRFWEIILFYISVYAQIGCILFIGSFIFLNVL